MIRRNAFLKKSRSYTLLVRGSRKCTRVLEAVKMVDAQGNVGENLSVVRNLVIQNACCKKAFIRGAFLAADPCDPEKFYHFEIVCASLLKRRCSFRMILTFDIDAKIVVRKKYYVVYIKRRQSDCGTLGLMVAHVALMELEISDPERNAKQRQPSGQLRDCQYQ